MIQNVLALAVIQGSNVVLPLILFPAALAMMNGENYTRLIFTETLSLLVVAVVLYGLDVIAVREVREGMASASPQRMARSLAGVLATRILLFVLGSCFALAGCFLYDPALSPVLAGWLLVPLAHAVQPTWFFNAIERNVLLGVLSGISRIGGVALAIVWMRHGAGAAEVALIVGLSFAACAVAALIYAIRRAGARVYFSEALADVPGYLRRGWLMFLSNLAVFFYRDFGLIILGLLSTSTSAMALYSIANKLFKMVQAVGRPLAQHYFPWVIERSTRAGAATPTLLRELWRCLIPQGVLLFLVWLAVLAALAADAKFNLLGGFLQLDRHDFLVLLCLLAPGSFFGLANFILGSVAMNAMQDDRLFLVYTLVTGAVGALSSFALALWLGVFGSAIAISLAELLLLLLILRNYLTHPKNA